MIEILRHKILGDLIPLIPSLIETSFNETKAKYNLFTLQMKAMTVHAFKKLYLSQHNDDYDYFEYEKASVEIEKAKGLFILTFQKKIEDLTSIRLDNNELSEYLNIPRDQLGIILMRFRTLSKLSIE